MQCNANTGFCGQAGYNSISLVTILKPIQGILKRELFIENILRFSYSLFV